MTKIVHSHGFVEAKKVPALFQAVKIEKTWFFSFSYSTSCSRFFSFSEGQCFRQ
jgi:hypothetical protein